jgi:hypothetical protein
MIRFQKEMFGASQGVMVVGNNWRLGLFPVPRLKYLFSNGTSPQSQLISRRLQFQQKGLPMI